MTRRSGQIRVEVDTHIDVEDIINELPDDVLRAEAIQRGMMADTHEDTSDLVALALEALRRNDRDECELLLVRLLFPKWSRPADCLNAFAKRRASA